MRYKGGCHFEVEGDLTQVAACNCRSVNPAPVPAIEFDGRSM